MNKVIAKGKTIEEAIENALVELGTTRDKVSTKVLEMPATGIIGMLSSKYVKVEVSVNEEDYETIIRDFLTGLFEKMHIVSTIEFSYEDDMIKVSLSADDMGILIGRRGQTLDAVQYLTSLVLNKNKKEYTRVLVDVNNYREKRKYALQDLADKIASKVERTKGSYALEPMNPYERRIIHAALGNYKNIDTHSEGEEPNRYVIVSYKK